MRAVRIEEFGGPEVLKAAEEDRPEPGPGEVLMEVRAAGVNRADVLTCGGGYHAAGQPPIIPGFEGSGTIGSVGDGVEDFAPGDKVFAFDGRPGFYAECVASDAHRHLEARRLRGKVVLRPQE